MTDQTPQEQYGSPSNFLPEGYWEFVEEWLPNYTHRDDVLGNDILTRYIDDELCEEDNADDLKEMRETYPTMEHAKFASDYDDLRLYTEALEAHKEASRNIAANTAAIIYHQEAIGWKYFLNDMDKIIDLATQYEKQFGNHIDWETRTDRRKGIITSERPVIEAESWDEHIIWFCKDKFKYPEEVETEKANNEVRIDWND